MRATVKLPRRRFLTLTALAPLPAASTSKNPPINGTPLTISETIGAIAETQGPRLIEGAKWYIAPNSGDGFLMRFPPGTLVGMHSLAADMLVDGTTKVVFSIQLQEGEQGRRFRLNFGELTQCCFRVRMALALTDQNRWQADREGAFLKPLCSGDRVDLAKVDRITFTVARKAGGPARWTMTPLMVAPQEVPKLTHPVLPKGPLVDEMGQSTLHDWPAKTRSVAELTARLERQLAEAPRQKWPKEFSAWGGWKGKRLDKGAGFFRVRKEGGRWWLVDPDGYAFWSTGQDCVRVDCEARYDGIEQALKWMPDPQGEFKDIYRTHIGTRAGAKYINYLAANLIRAFGPNGWREKWSTIALAELRRLRFNTVANWSEWEYASRARFPYVRPMSFRAERAPNIYRDFPDVYHPGFETDANRYAEQLASTKDDPALTGR